MCDQITDTFFVISPKVYRKQKCLLQIVHIYASRYSAGGCVHK